MKQLYSKTISASQLWANYKWLPLTFLFLFVFALHTQAQLKAWDKTFHRSSIDLLYSGKQTSDGGYILGGQSAPVFNGDVSSPPIAPDGYWIIKLDAAGNKLWEKVFGGSGAEYFTALHQTSDGGYILGGTSSSSVSGDKSEPSKGYYDYWVVKLDANGNKVWDKTIGGSEGETLSDLVQTSDGGYLLGGMSGSPASGDKTEASKGKTDYWVVKLDANGAKVWDRTIGGSGEDYLRSVIQTSDGAYIVAGDSHSGASGDRTHVSRGESDYWIVKLGVNGSIIWDKAYGSNSADWFSTIIETRHKTLVLGGMSDGGVSGDKSQPSRGERDYWIIKLDEEGNKVWDKTIGGTKREGLTAMQETSDAGYILGGYSYSGAGNEKSEPSKGESDYWIVKVDVNGHKLWDRTIGGSGRDILEDIVQTTDDTYFLAGHSESDRSGDKSQDSEGEDYWVVKLGSEAPPLPSGDCYTLTFNDEAPGLISSVITPAGTVAIVGNKYNSDGTMAEENHAAIFDSQAPTGDDTDLYTTNWGNVLIINQDLTNIPNDNQWGGDLILDFSAIGPVTMNSLKALDIDEYEHSSAVILYDAAGNELNVVYMQALGDNSKQTVNLGNTKGVMRMRISVGSAGIDDIIFCIEDANTTAAISQVTAYPNPTKERTTIAFKLRSTESYVVNLYDMKGNLVRELKTGQARAGELVSVEVNGSDLYDGLYIARIVSKSGAKSVKLMLKK